MARMENLSSDASRGSQNPLSERLHRSQLGESERELRSSQKSAEEDITRDTAST